MATPPIIEKALVIPPGMGLRALPKHRWQTSDLDELMETKPPLPILKTFKPRAS